MSRGAASLAPNTGLPLDETALIKAAQAGDQDAFGQLVRAYDQSVLRLALNLLRSPEDAQDVYQEAFLRVYRNLHTFRFDCSFHTWLYRIVTNLCLDQMRRRKVRREEPTVIPTSEGILDRVDGVADARADGDPQRNLYSGQIRKKIKEVLSGLTPRERMVFEMRHYQGLRLRNIGEILGTTEEAAKNCLFRANPENACGIRRLCMNCQLVREQLPLLLYGELSFDEEETVETHLETCADCRTALEEERELLAAFDQVAVEPSPALLRACREDLAGRLAMEASSVAVTNIPNTEPRVSLWDRFVDAITMPVNMLRPAGAVALVALGFLGARMGSRRHAHQLRHHVDDDRHWRVPRSLRRTRQRRHDSHRP